VSDTFAALAIRQRRVLNYIIESMGVDATVAQQLETDARTILTNSLRIARDMKKSV